MSLLLKAFFNECKNMHILLKAFQAATKKMLRFRAGQYAHLFAYVQTLDLQGYPKPNINLSVLKRNVCCNVEEHSAIRTG